jgi:hypothetical protein
VDLLIWRVSTSQTLDAQASDLVEMSLSSRTEENREIEMNRGGRDGEVVRRDHRSGARQFGEEVGPALRDRTVELHDRKTRDQRLDSSPSARRAARTIGETDADLQLGVDNGGKDGGLFRERTEDLVEISARSFDGDEGARIEH